MDERLCKLFCGNRMAVGLKQSAKWNRERTVRMWVVVAVEIVCGGGSATTLSGEVVSAM